MTPPPVRVLVVDDSAFARKVLREALSTSPLIEVVGIARDGLEALEKIAELKPDVVTLDLVMPNLDGLGVLQALPSQQMPRIVIVSVSDADSELAVLALERGAIDLVHKPTALATSRLYELSAELIEKVLAAAAARQPLREELPPQPHPAAAHRPAESFRHSTRRIVVVGTSTGGPQALTRLLRDIPADFPVPIAIVLHIPFGYTEAMARRLNDLCALEVVESSDGLVLRPGLVALGLAGQHLRIEQSGGLLIARQDPVQGPFPHCPSVDVLFTSVAPMGRGVLGLVMTGMGDDGLQGSRRIVAAGGSVVTEGESSCIIYGMPRVVVEAGLSSGSAPLEALASLLSSRT